MWKISPPVKCGPWTFHCSRFASEVRTKAPLRVPTSTRTPLILCSFSLLVVQGNHRIHGMHTRRPRIVCYYASVVDWGRQRLRTDGVLLVDSRILLSIFAEWNETGKHHRSAILISCRANGRGL